MGSPASRPKLIALGIAATCLLAGLATWVFWPDPPRQRDYLDATACLLTDEKGIAGAQVKPVWSAMQEASVAGLVRVQYLPVNGPQTTENARSYLASLVAGRCGAIIAVGPAQVDAVAKNAGAHPEIWFVTVGGGAPAGNVRVLDAADPDALRAGVKERIEALADAAS